jgi:hypothetical protein
MLISGFPRWISSARNRFLNGRSLPCPNETSSIDLLDTNADITLMKGKLES